MNRPGRFGASIFEVFSSIQGEGLCLGERQIFVRFGGCSLRCDYCDEPETIPLDSGEHWEGERLRTVILSHLRRGRHKSIAWTGGEPLLFPDFLAGQMAWARDKGLKNYLETNGIHTSALRKVLPLLDLAAIDLKLPSATGRSLWAKHAKFLAAAGRGFAKVVLTRGSTESEWRRVIRLMEDNAPEMPLVLQPATEAASTWKDGGRIRPIEPARAIKFLIWARARLRDVRLIPQWHPVWKIH